MVAGGTTVVVGPQHGDPLCVILSVSFCLAFHCAYCVRLLMSICRSGVELATSVMPAHEGVGADQQRACDMNGGPDSASPVADQMAWLGRTPQASSADCFAWVARTSPLVGYYWGLGAVGGITRWLEGSVNEEDS